MAGFLCFFFAWGFAAGVAMVAGAGVEVVVLAGGMGALESSARTTGALMMRPRPKKAI